MIMPKVVQSKQSRQKTIRVRDDLHAKLEEKADREKKHIIDVTDAILTNYFAAGEVDLLSLTIEEKLMDRLRRFEDRLAKMWGRQGMDTAMALIGVMTLLSRDIRFEDGKDVDIEQLLETIRPIAARHFSNKREEQAMSDRQ
jgi:hypothetical protein